MWGKKKKEHELFKREPRRYWYLLSAGVCIAILVVVIRGDLGMYIHPRYNMFTILMVLTAALLLVSAAAQYKYKQQTHIEYRSLGELALLFGRWFMAKGAWVSLLVIVLLVFVPPKPLLSAAADRKQMTEYELAYIETADWFSRPETVYQLSSVLQSDKGLEAQLGQEFTLSGFVRKDSDPNIMNVSRFVVSCCTVDARPATIAVYYPGWEGEFAVDEWIEVSGKLEVAHTGAGQRPLLQPTATQRIDQPKDPYNYL